MALDASALHAAVLDFMGQAPASTAEAAANFSKLYDDYAQDAMFGGSTPTLTGRRAIFEGVFAASLSSGVFATVTAAIGNAVAAYWGPSPSPVPVVGPQSGTVQGCPGAAGIAAALAALLPFASKATAAATLSAALHTATTSCTALVSPPASTVVPIS